MANKGTDFELTVKRMEELLSQSDVIKIQHNVELPDKDSGQSRQIDIWVTTKVGSIELSIMFECRDRNKKGGSDWIEQVAQKRKSVGANQAVVVSSKGFSEPALKKAKALNIITKTVEDIELSDIKGWFSETMMSFTKMSSRIKGVIFNLANLDKFKERHKIADSTSAFDEIIHFETGKSQSVDYIWRQVLAQQPQIYIDIMSSEVEFESFSSSNEAVMIFEKDNINIEFPETTYLYETVSECQINKIRLSIEFKLEVVELTPSKPQAYIENGKTSLQEVEVAIPIDNSSTVQIIFSNITEQNRTYFKAYIKEDDKPST